MEAWVKEIPNVLILPRSADYSEEVWMEIREKAITLLQTFFFDNVVPKDAVSDEEEEELEIGNGEQRLITCGDSALPDSISKQLTEDIVLTPESSKTKVSNQHKESPSHRQSSNLSHGVTSRSETTRSRSCKKAKKRHAWHKSQQKASDSFIEGESTSLQDDVTTVSGTDQVLSSSSRLASPDESRSRKTPIDSIEESSFEQRLKSSCELARKSGELLEDGYVIAIYARDRPAIHISRQRVQGGGWFLDSVSNVTKRDPAAQFLVVFCSKDLIGLRSFTAGGKLLQINGRKEFVFSSHSFDVWETWTLEGSLKECRLVNCGNHQAALDVRIEVLAAVGNDGITRWLD